MWAVCRALLRAIRWLCFLIFVSYRKLSLKAFLNTSNYVLLVYQVRLLLLLCFYWLIHYNIHSWFWNVVKIAFNLMSVKADFIAQLLKGEKNRTELKKWFRFVKVMNEQSYINGIKVGWLDRLFFNSRRCKMISIAWHLTV